MADYIRIQGTNTPDSMRTGYIDLGSVHARVDATVLVSQTGPISTTNPLPVTVRETWTVENHLVDLIGDSDVWWEVPTGREWHILFVTATYVADANVGNRQLQLDVRRADLSLVALLARAGAVQAASSTRYYTFAPGLADLTAFRDTDFLTTPIPSTVVLRAGDFLRLWDNKQVAGMTDSLRMSLQVAYHDI